MRFVSLMNYSFEYLTKVRWLCFCSLLFSCKSSVTLSLPLMRFVCLRAIRWEENSRKLTSVCAPLPLPPPESIRSNADGIRWCCWTFFSSCSSSCSSSFSGVLCSLSCGSSTTDENDDDNDDDDDDEMTTINTRSKKMHDDGIRLGLLCERVCVCVCVCLCRNVNRGTVKKKRRERERETSSEKNEKERAREPTRRREKNRR